MDIQIKPDPDLKNDRKAMLGLYQNLSLHRGTVANALMDLSVTKGCPADPLTTAHCNEKERKHLNDTAVEQNEIAKIEIKGEPNSDFSSGQSDRLLMSSNYRHYSTLRALLDQKAPEQTIAKPRIGSHFGKCQAEKSDGYSKSLPVPAKQPVETTENHVYKIHQSKPSNLANKNKTKRHSSKRTQHGQDQADESRIDEVHTVDTHDEILVRPHFGKHSANKSYSKSVPIPAEQTTETTQNPVYRINPPKPINQENKTETKQDCSRITEHGQEQPNESRIDEVHTADTHDENTFLCGDCQSEFPRQADLLDHIEYSHPDTAKQVTIAGGKRNKKKKVCIMSIDERIFISYKYQVKTKRPFGCLICDFADNGRHRLRRHLQAHFGIRPFLCELCGRKFKQKIGLQLHLETHSEHRSHVCKICGAKFGGIRQLNQHVSQHGTFRCGVCGKVFTTKHWYKNHSHKTASNCLCEYCGKTFANRSTLRNHLTSHGSTLVEKHVPCTQCEKSFKNKSKLTSHIRHCHKPPVVCDICNKRFRGFVPLKTHMVRRHQEIEPFVCEQCGKRFCTPHQLKAHSFTHTGEKPYKCKECSAGFTRSDYLRKHELTHSGEKPYLCNVCGKGFSRKSNLNVHVKWHLRMSDKQKRLVEMSQAELCVGGEKKKTKRTEQK